jgi:hypothetical protein
VDAEEPGMAAGFERHIRRKGAVVLYKHGPVRHAVDHSPDGVQNDAFVPDLVQLRFCR